VLTSVPALELWRAPTDNDAAMGHFGRFAMSGFARPEITALPSIEHAGRTVLRTSYAADGCRVLHERVVGVDSRGLVVRERLVVPEEASDRLLRIGTRLDLPAGYRWVRWWGRGPHESYPDRKTSARLGLWTSDIDDLATGYLRPQENGSRSDTARIELRGPGLPPLRITLDRPLQVGVSRYLPAELAAARHWWELEPGGEVHVFLDVAQRGIGTASVGADVPDEHRIREGDYEWAWRLESLG
jgi:beta-galactosidase